MTRWKMLSVEIVMGDDPFGANEGGVLRWLGGIYEVGGDASTKRISYT